MIDARELLQQVKRDFTNFRENEGALGDAFDKTFAALQAVLILCDDCDQTPRVTPGFVRVSAIREIIVRELQEDSRI